MHIKNLSIVVKVTSLLLLLAAVALSGVVLMALETRSTTASFDHVSHGAIAARKYLNAADRSIVWVERSMIQNIWAQSDADNAKYLADTKQGEASFVAAMKSATDVEPSKSAEFGDLVKRFEMITGTTCAKAIEMGNIATTLEGDSKAFDEMNANCEPLLIKLSSDVSALTKKLTEESDAKVGALITDADIAAYSAVGLVLVGLVLVLALAIVLSRIGIVTPIRKLMETMTRMTEGNFEALVQGTDRKDEIGAIARSLDRFRASLAQAEEMREQRDAELVKSAEIAGRRSAEATAFISRMNELAKGFNSASGNVSEAARNLSASAEEASRQAQAVASAAEEASVNVQTVAASTEEMTASIREIGTQVRAASEISDLAGQEASRTETEVRALAESVNKIGEVVALISSIASQTNLLALNATIEAARAGEMGRGFAIVAQEVKQLAAQTAKATDEIGTRIGEIQQATGRTVGSIDKIVGTIDQIRTISATISSAVQQQGAATNEIAQNTQKASEGTEAVTHNISGVGRAAEMTGEASTDLMALSNGLAGQAQDLQREVSAFVERLKA